MKYKDQIGNKKITEYKKEKESFCSICDNLIISKATIMFQAGNTDLCMTCNVKRGLIK